MTNTVRRLGGTGIQASDARDLEAFFATLPAPRTPTVDSRAVARGKALFHSSSLGCASCHNGSKMTDGKRYDLADDLGKVDTPSLIGLAASAPYYHDGSAADLRALLLEKGSIHGMGRLDVLEGEQVDDLVSFLRTL
jgi:cytochrome c peroxidase